MSQFVTDLFQSFPTVVSSLAKGVKDGFSELLWVDPLASEKILSDPVQFIAITGGITLGIGLLWGTFRLMRGRARV